MPVNDHLAWMEVTDFRAGLWTKGRDWLMPSTAAQRMRDCYPIEDQGLRAFFRPQFPSAPAGANLLTPNQASFETSTAGYQTTNCTIQQSSAQHADGQFSLQTTASSTGLVAVNTPTGLNGVPVSPSTQYTALASWKAGVTTQSVRVDIKWYDATGALISTSTGASTVDSAAVFTQVSNTATSPVNAAFAAVFPTIVTQNNGTSDFLDKVSFAQGNSTTWAPGLLGLDTANEVYFGIFANPSGGINPSSDRYLMAWNITTHVPRLYYTTNPVTSPWVCISNGLWAATSSTPTLKQSFFSTYLSGTTRKVVFNLNVGSANDGIWIMNPGGASPTQMTVTGGTAPSGPVVVHQARIVVADGSNIRWTDPGTETFQAANFLNVEPSGLRPNAIAMTTFEPSDLIIGKEAGPFILVQGDLSNPIVRSMDETFELVAGQQLGLYSGYLFATGHRDGVFRSTPGGGTEKISHPLSLNNFSLPAVFGTYIPSWIGDIIYAEGFLFTPGAIMHMNTNAWFTSNAEAGNVFANMYTYDRAT